MLGLATRMRDTAFKQTLAELEVGDEVDVEEPKGSFVLPEETDRALRVRRGRHRHHGLPLACSATSPTRGCPYRITLVYSNRDRESAAFLDELPELERRIAGLRVVLTMTDDDGWDGETRRIDEDMLRDHLGELDRLHLPRRRPAAEWRRASRRCSQDAGVPDEQVVADSFSGY